MQTKNPFLKFLLTGAVALALAAANAVFGQAITTSSLTGTVTNNTGQPISGAALTILHVPTGSSYTATSRADGTFVLRGLRPGGPYTVSSTAVGQVPTELREVYLDIDRGADVVVRMEAEDVVTLDRFEITASAEDTLFDVNKTGSGSYLTSEDISNLPAGDRSINALARMDPRISYNRDPFDRGISVSGLSNRFNSIQVDGVSASDPFGLNANNTAAERNVIPVDSLEALSVDTSPYNSRNAGFVGARINAITKSGTNDFKGSLYYTYRGNSALGGYRMVGEQLDGTLRAISEFSEETLGATLGGPIIPNKLFFYVSYEKVDEVRIPPSPAFAVDTTTLNQITQALTSLGFSPGSATPPAGNKLKDDNILVKLDWEINSNHRATVRYNNVESSRPTYPGFGTGGAQNNFSFDSHWYDQSIKNESYIGQFISRWSDRLNTEISLSRSTYDSMPINNTRQPSVQVRNVPVPGSTTSFIMAGTELSRHANILEVVTDTAELFASYELSDNHTLQVGFQYDTADIYNLFVQRAYGSYEFDNLAQLQAVAANNNGTVQYRLFSYNQIIPGVNPAAEFGETNTGFFINDVWRVNPNLTLNIGARVDVPGLPDAIPFNQSFQTTFGIRNDHTYDGEQVFQPRFGFNWQPSTEKRTVVRGGFGLFYGRAPRVWVSNSYSNTGANFRSYSAGTAGGGLQAPAVSANPDSQPVTASVPPAQQVAFIDPDFQLPSRWKANIAVERALGFWDLKATAEYEQTWVKKDIFYDNINIQQTRTGPDGRAMYFNAYGATSSGTRLVNTGFTNRIIRLGNTDEGGTESFTFSLERPRTKDGWYWRAAYVNTSATEVLFGTSSVAASNWNNRSVFNTNAPEKKRSELEIKDKVMFTLTKDIEFIKGNKTTFSLFYEGRSGYPYSLVFNSDANGDGLTNNDLIYVPTANDPMVRYATPADQDNFNKIVERFGLTRGQAVSASSETYPWVNQFDFGIKQAVKLPGWRHRLVLGLDILNVGNLLNDKWGLIRGSNQFFRKFETVSNVAFDGVNNQYVISNVNANLANNVPFAPSLGRGEPAASRWSAMLSARYEF
ncbi:MAG: TonB-dependent receptor [Opitutaceae bacterium]|nr:TonB-dependent receptor [Opitutaceae bacterium]